MTVVNTSPTEWASPAITGTVGIGGGNTWDVFIREAPDIAPLGGAISGEHGIGLAKTPFLRLQHSEAEIGAMRAVKQALDPKGILNPGKMFEVFETWKQPKVAVSFPWDHK